MYITVLEWVNCPLFVLYSERMLILETHIEQLVKPLLKEENILLCEVKISGSPMHPKIQIFIDREVENVTINDCVKFTRDTQDLIELQDDVPSDYKLEVSSPGIDYPLKEVWQFRKNTGRSIQFQRQDDHEEDLVTFNGKILEVLENETIKLETSWGVQEFKLQELTGSKVIIETPKRKNSKRKRHETRRR